MPERKRYTVLSEEGANFSGDPKRLARPVEIGEEVELEDVFADQEKALVAAGWLERIEDKKGKK